MAVRFLEGGAQRHALGPFLFLLRASRRKNVQKDAIPKGVFTLGCFSFLYLGELVRVRFVLSFGRFSFA